MRSLAYTFAICLLPICSLSQWSGPTPPSAGQILNLIEEKSASFWEICEHADSLSNTGYEDLLFEKQFGRWYNFYKNRVDASGNLSLVNDLLIELTYEDPPVCSGNGSWEQIGPIQSPNSIWVGRIESVYSHPTLPNTVLAGSNSGGLWKTIDGGANWLKVSEQLGMPAIGIHEILQDPSDPDILYVATGHDHSETSFGMGIIKSEDGGDTWNPTAFSYSAMFGAEIFDIALHPSAPLTIYAVDNRYVYRTTNGFETYNELTDQIFENPRFIDGIEDNEDFFFELEILPDNPNVIIVAARKSGEPVNASIYISTDGGDTWNNRTPNSSNSNTGIDYPATVFGIAVDGSEIIAHCRKTISESDPNLDRFPILTSTDNGVFWTEIMSDAIGSAGAGAITRNFNVFEAYRDENGDLIAYGGSVELGKSTDVESGNSFANIHNINFMHRDIRGMHLYSTSTGGANDRLIVGTDGTVNISEDGGTTWTSINGAGGTSPFICTQFFDIAVSNIDPSFIAGGTQDNGTFITFNQGLWNRESGGDGGQTIIDWSNPRTIFARANGVLRKTTDANNFTNIFTITNDDNDRFKDHILRQDPIRSDSLFAAFKQNFWEFDANGSLRRNVNFNTDVAQENVEILTFEIAPSNNDVIYLSCLGRAPSDEVIDPNDPNNTINVYRDRFFKSTDRGETWEDITNNFTEVQGGTSIYNWFGISAMAIDPLNPERIFVGINGFKQENNQHMLEGGAQRVMLSEDGGNTWTDMSTGLYTLPINDLIYQYGTKDVLYCGTDAGIFRYDPDQSIWECFNNGFSISIIDDLEIEYCTGSIYAGTFGDGVWRSPLEPTPDYVVDEITTWGAETRMFAFNDIVIQSGNRLTIQGFLHMAEGTEIFVEQGAELIVDGGVITNECGDLWEGIRIQGNSLASQWGVFPNNPQGKAVFTNRAVVEHAELGVTNWDGQSIGNSGGIIQALNSTFRNNRQDAYFMIYQNTNPVNGDPIMDYSHFSDCDFVLDDDPETGYRGGEDVRDRVFLGFVNGVTFTGCRFDNQHPDLTDNEIAGINSFDSRFTVQALCTVPITNPPGVCPPGDLIRSSFTNLFFGIRAQRIQGNRTYNVTHTDFNDNVFGVLSEFVDDFVITRCNFDMGNSTSGIWFNVGLMINTGVGFTVQENNFIGPNDAGTPVQPHEFGTVAIDLGATENMIDLNTFDGLFVANQAIGDNSGLNNQAPGLQYNCIDQFNCFYDIVVEETNNPTGNDFDTGIRHLQGEFFDGTGASIAAQNTFSNNNSDITIAEEDFYNHSDLAIRHLFDNNVANSMALEVTPAWVLQPQATTPNDCILSTPNPHKILTIGEVELLKDDVDYFNDELLSVQYLYYSIIDQGNQPELVENIQFEWSNDAWEMRDQLIARSPNLSKETLLEAAMTGVLPDALLMEVLLANIGSVKDQEFLDELQYNIPNPLPQYMIDILAAAPEPETLRQDLEEQIGYFSGRKALASKLLIHNAILIDTIPDELTFVEMLNINNTPESHLALAEYYLTNSEFDSAQQIIDSLPYRFEYILKNSDYFSDYQQIFTIKKQTLQNGSFWDKLTLADIQSLQSIAGSSGQTADVLAHNILRFATNHEFHREPVIPNSGSGQQLIFIDPFEEINARMTEVDVFPNPAKDYVTIEYKFPEYIESFTIIISDITGRLVLKQEESTYKGQFVWDTRQVGQGIYFINILSRNSQLFSGKVAIEK
ncbi:MAG: T9SS type A sorting domain-containing protein [Bacteroidota bacterium]